MEFISNYSPVGDVGICVLCLIVIISLRESFVHSSTNFKIFYSAVICIMLAAVSNVLFYKVCMDGEAMWIRLFFRACYRICMIGTLECYIVYFYTMLLLEDKRILVVSASVNLFLFVMDVLEPVGDVVAYDSPFSLAFFLSFFMSASICVYLICKHSYAIVRQLRRALLLTEVICLILITVEYLARHNSYMTFTFLLPVLVVMFMAHSNPYNLKTGALNLDSFDDYLKNGNRDNEYYMCLKFLNREDFEIPDKLGMILKSFWRGYFKKAVLFNPMSEFVILAIPDRMERHRMLERMQRLILYVFPQYYKEFQIDYKIIVFNHVHYCNSFQEFDRIFNFFAAEMEDNTYKICDSTDMERLNRIHYITQQLQDIYDQYDLNDDRVLVYCQPIINTAQRVYDTAEALMRLQLPGEGIVSPTEFVPMIEEMNLVHRFSMIILNKVCKHLRELEDYDFKRISVNFSVYELRNPDFVDDFKEIVTANKISYEKIGVEFTESTDINDFETIKKVISQLRKLGCSIYLDDFGTGYSNFERLLGLNMDVVKFDRSLVLLAEENVKAKFALKSFSDAFMKMQFKVLYEGIETSEQEALCVDSNANYLQGFKYSKPVPIENLCEFLRKRISW